MAYSNLIDDIFSEIENPSLRNPIYEREFAYMLPSLFDFESKRRIWEGHNLASLLYLRYGLLGNKEHTYQECSLIFNISVSRCQQLIMFALRALRNPIRLEKYAPNSVPQK